MTYILREYILVTTEIKNEIIRGIDVAGSKGCLAREVALNNGANINKILLGETRTIHKDKYRKLKELII